MQNLDPFNVLANSSSDTTRHHVDDIWMLILQFQCGIDQYGDRLMLEAVISSMHLFQFLVLKVSTRASSGDDACLTGANSA